MSQVQHAHHFRRTKREVKPTPKDLEDQLRRQNFWRPGRPVRMLATPLADAGFKVTVR